jgi:acyl carrier protein
MTGKDGLRDAEREVLEGLAELIREVIGETWAEDIPITMDTSFEQDLELESIELVALAERVRERYGPGVDFTGWLSGMELDQVIALRVGQVVEFIAQCR